MKHTFIILLFLVLGFSANATHIVGGELRYKCLGNNRFQIEMSIYRDCQNGQPWFDFPGYFAVFNSKNERVDSVTVNPVGNDTLILFYPDSCLFLIDKVCVHTTTYSFTMTLPPIDGGYTIAYQRCCRNKIIDNLVDPEGTGATFSAYISKEAILACNNSPKYKLWPPVNICAGYDINFDHSAIDSENDKIVYRLCTPYKGLSDQNPGGDIFPENPPFEEVVWKTPTFNLLNMLGSAKPLRIDSVTGRINGIPDFVGQYVVGVCMDEYRNGVLFSTIRRDFQYNVGLCTKSVATLFAPDILCDKFTVDFKDKSIGASDWEWNFGDKKTPNGGFSTLRNPTYTYQDTGTFKVRLIVNKSDPNCSDTAFKTIKIQNTLVNADFVARNSYCIDTSSIAVTNLSTDTVFGIATYKWTLLDNKNQKLDSSFVEKPIFKVPSNNTYILKLETISKNGCFDSLRSIVVVPPNVNLPIVVNATANPNLVYSGQPSQLQVTDLKGFKIQWSPMDSISNATIPNPIVYPKDTTIYTVTMVDSNGCSVTKMVEVRVLNGICRDPNIFVPNAFTPNGDSVNDVLYVRGGIISELYFAVFNRWGEKVFETTDKSLGWDGTYKGEELPSEVFGYILKAKCLNGQTYQSQGNVSLIR